MTSPWWEAMVAVPRSAFIPETVWHDTDRGLQPLRRTEHPDRWHELANGILWLADDESRAWARLHHDPPSPGGPDSPRPHRVHQYGPRALWLEVEAAYQWWVDAGSPGANQWRFTVTPQGQGIELITR